MFVWERELLDEFNDTLTFVCLVENKSNEWVWSLDASGISFNKNCVYFYAQ